MKKITILVFLSLIPSIISASETMEMNINKFGDVAVQYSPEKRIPNLSQYLNQLVVISGTPDGFRCEDLPYFLGKTKELGNLFGNKYAENHFPALEDGMISSACSVIFVQHADKTFAVLVQVKKRKYLMNSAGFADKGESFKDAAIREALEETNLKINPHAWKPLATWTFEQKYAGLSIPGRTIAGYAFTQMPAEWIHQLSGPITKIDIRDNDETESITLVDVASLPECQKLNKEGAFSSNFGGHHFNLVLVAAVRAGLISDKWLQLQEPVDYLTSFRFIDEGSE